MNSQRNSSPNTMNDQQGGLPFTIRSLAVSERQERREYPFFDVSNRQILTPRWSERSSSSSSLDLPLPSLDYENSPVQPRHLNFIEYPVVTPPGRLTPANSRSGAPLPYLPFMVEDEDHNNTTSRAAAVRLAPRYDRHAASRF
eukprot:scaffold5325_cov183-Amphora_coffeaeformis.AAC.10